MKIVLKIEGPHVSQAVVVDGEVTIGRTALARVVIDDPGLSRVNTTFFVDEDQLYAADENSLNGTFVNGTRIGGPPVRLHLGDEIKVGNATVIRIESDDANRSALPDQSVSAVNQRPPQNLPAVDFSAAPTKLKIADRLPVVLIAAAVLAVIIIIVSALAFLIVSRQTRHSPAQTPAEKTPPIVSGAAIPVRVIDPLGGENEDDLDDLIASWEVQEEEIKADTVADVAVAAGDTAEAELNVTAAFLADRQRKAFEPRTGETGVRPAGLNVPPELFGGTVIKQKLKLAEMKTKGYSQPLDFAELAEKRLARQLIEMPMATESFYLDVGGSARDTPFTLFNFKDGDVPLVPASPEYEPLARLAANFSGQRYDLNNPADRRQMRMRLLRMFNPQAKPILKELADAYFKKFGRPLRVTSLTRSMDYQISLNANNPNSFKVTGEGSLPPHTSGCAFDLARKHMTAEEQNFVMQKLAEMERAGRIDALIESGVNACFHIFIYNDGRPPAGWILD